MQGWTRALSNLKRLKLNICSYYSEHYSDHQKGSFHHPHHTDPYQQCVKCLLQLRKCAEGYHRNMSDRNSGQQSLFVQHSVVEYKVSEVLENMH